MWTYESMMTPSTLKRAKGDSAPFLPTKTRAVERASAPRDKQAEPARVRPTLSRAYMRRYLFIACLTGFLVIISQHRRFLAKLQKA